MVTTETTKLLQCICAIHIFESKLTRLIAKASPVRFSLRRSRRVYTSSPFCPWNGRSGLSLLLAPRRSLPFAPFRSPLSRSNLRLPVSRIAGLNQPNHDSFRHSWQKRATFALTNGANRWGAGCVLVGVLFASYFCVQSLNGRLSARLCQESFRGTIFRGPVCSSAKKPSPEVNRRGGVHLAFLPRFPLPLAFRESAAKCRGGISKRRPWRQ
jgi:hypothetical protein